MDLPKGFHKEVIEARENNPESVSNINNIVSTKPLKSGGASFKTNVLIEESNSKLAYKPSIGVAIFCSAFSTIGVGLTFYSIYPLYYKNSESVNLILLLVGLIFTFVSFFMFYNFYKPRVFDKQLGIYYSAYNFNLHDSNKSKTGNYIPLNRIVALQIIGEHVRSDDRNYKSFELNLVLDDTTRRNVVDHGNLKSIIEDAHILSDFINVPIWHAKSDNKIT